MLDFVNMATYHVCVLIWFYYLLVPGKVCEQSLSIPLPGEQSRRLEPGTGASGTPMTLAIILVIVAALALIFILGITVSRSLQVSAGANLAGKIQPIDVEAFRNLDRSCGRRLPAPPLARV